MASSGRIGSPAGCNVGVGRSIVAVGAGGGRVDVAGGGVAGADLQPARGRRRRASNLILCILAAFLGS